MIKAKRILVTAAAALMIACSALGAAGCGKKDDFGLSAVKVPVYEKGPEFMIGAWGSPAYETVADYQMAKDMGLTHLFTETKSNFDLCEKVGIKAIAQLGNAGGSFQSPLTLGAIELFNSSPAVVGVNYYDEPNFEAIPHVSDFVDQHMETFGEDKFFFSNLYPNWATQNFGGKTWNDYLEYWYQNVLSKITVGKKILSYDIYPITGSATQHSLNSVWLTGLQGMAATAQKYDLDVHAFIQAQEHQNYPVMTEADLRYQFAVYLAFGVKNFSYFMYRAGSTWPGCSALVRNDRPCSPYDLYYGAQRVNFELKAMEHVYLNFDWVGTMPVFGTDVQYSDPNMFFDGAIEYIPFIEDCVATQDTLLGQFKDAAGNDGLMVTNFSQPFEQKESVVQLKFNNAKKLAVYTMGTEEVYVLDQDKIVEITLAPGQGAFMLPVA